MKKILAIMLVICLVFSLAACNNSEDPSSDPSTENASTFEKPENYSVVLLASINPQIKMYLADDGIVLAVEAVNEDAEQIVDEVMLENADYQTVIKAFVSAANSKGFINDGAKIEFEVVEQKDNKLVRKVLLENASLAAENAAADLNITLEVVAGDVGSDETDTSTESTDQSSDNTEQTETHTHIYSKATCTEAAKCSCGATDGNALGHSWQSATCKTPKTCKTCGATEGSKGDHTYSNGICSVCGTSAPHSHSYSKATCTEAAKCSCGATNGSALGHSWQSATCKAPKACKTCGATEGSKGDHSYTNGTCSVCGETTSLNPKTELKSSVEYIGNLRASGNMLYGSALQFEDGVCVVVSREYSTEKSDPTQPAIVFNGTSYYSLGGGQDPHNVELTDTEIIVKGSMWGDAPDAVTIKLTLQSNGILKVTYSTNTQFPVGTVLSTNINDVLS